MRKFQLISILCIAAFLVIFSAGCTGSETEQVTPTNTVIETAVQTEASQSDSHGEYSVHEDLPAEILVEVDAKVVDSGTLLINYNLDLSSMGTAMRQDGWQVLVTAYAYNPNDMESGFSVRSYDDIIAAGIPYKTSKIHIFPSNVYPGKIEVSTNPTTNMKIDTGDYYIYGVVLREA